MSFEFTVGRRQLNRILAHNDGVQAALDDEVTARAMAAGRELAAHRHDDHARIEVERGDVDRFLILSDDRGLKAAMSIEYGRKPNSDGNGGMEGLMILHRAVGLKRKGKR